MLAKSLDNQCDDIVSERKKVVLWCLSGEFALNVLELFNVAAPSVQCFLVNRAMLFLKLGGQSLSHVVSDTGKNSFVANWNNAFARLQSQVKLMHAPVATKVFVREDAHKDSATSGTVFDLLNPFITRFESVRIQKGINIMFFPKFFPHNLCKSWDSGLQECLQWQGMGGC